MGVVYDYGYEHCEFYYNVYREDDDYCQLKELTEYYVDVKRYVADSVSYSNNLRFIDGIVKLKYNPAGPNEVELLVVRNGIDAFLVESVILSSVGLLVIVLVIKDKIKGKNKQEGI